MTSRRLLSLAFIISMLIHFEVIWVTGDLDWLHEQDLGTARAEEETIELILEPASDEVADDLPTAYTDIPERIATEDPPARPDFLALHHSRAADLVPGDVAERNPAADLESPVEQVAIRAEQLDGSGQIAYVPSIPGIEQPGQPATGRDEAVERFEGGQPAGESGDFPLREALEETAADEDAAEAEQSPLPPLPELDGGGAPSILKPGEDDREAGDQGFDFDQFASGNLSGNVLETGGYNLSTYEWNFAPWMQRFGQDVRRHWFAPYAYGLGVIDGMTRLKLVVEPDGSAGELQVLETEGHESLEQASVAALKAASPFDPLPRDFPEDNLVIILTLHYPAWKIERLPPRSQPEPRRSGRRIR